MTTTKTLNKAMNYDGSTIEIVELYNDHPIPGVGQRSYAVNHSSGTIGVRSYEDAVRLVTGFGDVPLESHDRYGTPTTVNRTGFGLPEAALVKVAEPYREPSPDVTPQNAPTPDD